MSVIKKINKKLNKYLGEDLNGEPNTLYLGYQEFARFAAKRDEMARLGMVKKNKTNERMKFQGMIIYMVHAEQHISFGRI